MLDDYQALKRKVENLRREAHQAEGALKEIATRLKKEFGCDSIEEAKALLDKLLKKEIALARRVTKAKRAFEKKWKHVLDKE